MFRSYRYVYAGCIFSVRNSIKYSERIQISEIGMLLPHTEEKIQHLMKQIFTFFIKGKWNFLF